MFRWYHSNGRKWRGTKEPLRVKEESEEKAGLKFNIQKTKIMASGPITSWQIDGEKVEIVADFIFLGSKINVASDRSHEIKRCLLLGRKALTNLDSIWKSRDITLPTKVHQNNGFTSSHVWMLELDYKESWVLKNWCFWTVVLAKTHESPLDCKGIQPVHPKGNQCWPFTGRTDNIRSKAEITLSCLTFCDLMDCIVHGILLTRILEWVAFSFYRVSSQPRD